MHATWGGELLRTTMDEVRIGSLPAVGLPGEVFAGSVRQAGREATSADLAARDAARLQDTEVRVGLGLLTFACQALLHARLRLACEVAERGLHTAEGFALVDWLALRCPDLDQGSVRDLGRLATAAREGVHAPLLTAVLGRGMPLARAGRIHRALARVRWPLSPEEYAAAVQLLADAGSNPLFEDADIARIIAELLRACLPEKDHEARRKAQHALRDVHESSLADGSVKRIIMTFGDDADYEAVRAILRSPLAAPASKEELEATGEEDPRTPGNRRYDAFMTVIRRGVAGTRGQPTTPKAMLLVTLDFETLKRQLAQSQGNAPGCGATLDGASVSAETIRRLACEADLVPMVLGGAGEVLDQGRRHRLVTPGQRVRLAVRDRGCTIPGCTVPATWCDAHHVVPWSHGGRSDLSNYALLCPRHHTWVHETGRTATVSASGVTWHLL
ncbi:MULTISPECIES: DUF222 domain-containing protein [unclassified Ornithinimicrobium]|uniref:HNH endonuclease signature motif containing protein n=1 Tax=unclassified Ornithinimicrobium TaxID=2615080 RepID=UPI003852A59E